MDKFRFKTKRHQNTPKNLIYYYLENSFTVGTFKLFFPKTKSVFFQIGPRISYKLVLTAKFLKSKDFKTNFKQNLTCIFYLSDLIKKTQFAMTNPV